MCTACNVSCVLQPAVCHAEVITQPPETVDTLYLECQNNEELSRHKMQHFSVNCIFGGWIKVKIKHEPLQSKNMRELMLLLE